VAERFTSKARTDNRVLLVLKRINKICFGFTSYQKAKLDQFCEKLYKNASIIALDHKRTSTNTVLFVTIYKKISQRREAFAKHITKIEGIGRRYYIDLRNIPKRGDVVCVRDVILRLNTFILDYNKHKESFLRKGLTLSDAIEVYNAPLEKRF
jgi:hypothetical protein